MKKYLISFLLAGLSCKNFIKENEKINDTLTGQVPAPVSGRDSLEDAYFSDIIPEFEREYRKVMRLDTGYVLKGDTFSIHLTHQCDTLNTLLIPEKYVTVYGLKEFAAHPFFGEIKVERNGVSFFSQRITISTFHRLLDESVRLYGSILYPVFSLDSNKVKMRYSVSIPLTDVGKTCTAVFDIAEGELVVE